MEYTKEELEALALPVAPPLDPAFTAYEAEQASKSAPVLPDALEERRSAYKQQCRDTYQVMTAEGARDHYLSQGVDKTWLTIKALDGFDIPVMQLDLTENKGFSPDVVIVYVHGGGLAIGEADSEELTCRRMLKANIGQRIRLYSVGYRLKDPHSAETCVSDSLCCFDALKNTAKKIILAGSSSGGQIAAELAQRQRSIHGLILRGPVTADIHSGLECLPERFRGLPNSVNDSCINSMGFYLKRAVPRDGLPLLPLEADEKGFAEHPRTWIQVSTNDTLYSDGLFYAMALHEAGVPYKLDVIHGWPHTFWLPAPQLDRSLKAEDDMIEGLKWLAS